MPKLSTARHVKPHTPSSIIILLLTLTSILLTIQVPGPVHALPSIEPGLQPGPALVSVWSDTYQSSNITDTNLTPGTFLTIEIIVSNAQPFNGYELSLYYDQNYLQATSTDLTTNTVFDRPFPLANELYNPGIVRLSVVNLGSSFDLEQGTLAHITFKILNTGVSSLTLAAGMTQPSGTAQGATRLVLGYQLLDVTTTDGYFKNNTGEKLGPAASLTIIPANPQQGDITILDASGSFDADHDILADRGIAKYIWDFGDGFGTETAYPAIAHRYGPLFGYPSFGNFSTRLTILDMDNNFTSIKTLRVEIGNNPPASSFTLSAAPNQFILSPGTSDTATIKVSSLNAFQGTISLTATALPTSPSGPVSTFNPPTLDLPPAGAATSTITINIPQNAPPGKYALVVTGASGEISRSDLIFLLVRPLEPVFIRGRVSWTHHLSLSSNNNTQTWISKVTNPNMAADLEIRFLVAAFGSSGLAFIEESAPIILHAQETRLDLTTTHLFNSGDVGVKFLFTEAIIWKFPTTGELLTSSTFKSGSFTVVP